MTTPTPPVEPTGELRRLQQNVARHIADLGALQRVLVTYEKTGDILGEIEKRINQLGIAVLVLNPVVRTTIPDTKPCPVLDNITLGIQVSENVTFNHGKGGTGLHALDVAEHLLVKLASWNWSAASGTGYRDRFLSPTEEPIAFVAPVPGFPATNTYAVTFNTTVVPRDPYATT